MRCPYCGGLNRDQSTFCVNCGRDMRNTVSRTPNTSAQQQVAYPPSQPATYPPAQPQVPRPPTQPQPPSRPAQHSSARGQAPRSQPVSPAPVQPFTSAPDPEPPVPFPPRSLAQFEALLAATATQQYTVLETRIENSKKKIVLIAYPRCADWQQAATLFKVFKDQQEEKCNIIVIQGVVPQQPETYGFTNGQLQFDRGVRLGSKVGNRYVVETGNGFASGAVRFMLNE